MVRFMWWPVGITTLKNNNKASLAKAVWAFLHSVFPIIRISMQVLRIPRANQIIFKSAVEYALPKQGI